MPVRKSFRRKLQEPLHIHIHQPSSLSCKHSYYPHWKYALCVLAYGWSSQSGHPYIPWGDELFWHPSRYPVAGTELIESKWSTKLCFICSQTTLSLLFCPYSCQIGIQMPREMKFCMSYWGDTTVDYNSFCLCSAKPAGPSIEQIVAANE